MQQRLEMVGFGVTGLVEVRAQVKRWKKVLAGLAREDEGPSLVWKTHRQMGVEVLLTFLAPKEGLDRFLTDLRAQGLEV